MYKLMYKLIYKPLICNQSKRELTQFLCINNFFI